MPELEEVKKVKTAGFVDSRYTKKDRIAREEKELQELIGHTLEELLGDDFVDLTEEA